ncbi:extracellular solute-binding protein [Halapricum sp. CBA1109]|nr:extracellular solute-binding protein [Halapricum sp. CBA1109]
MGSKYSRRSLLRMGGPALAIGLAGCSSESDTSGSTASGIDEGTAATTRVTTPDEPECDYQAIDPDEPSGTVKLVHGRDTSDIEFIESTNSRFESITDNEVELNWVPVGCYAVIRNSMSDGDGPHLIERNHDEVDRYDRLDFLSDQAGNIDLPDCVLPDKALELSRFDEELVGMPWAAQTVALFYNGDMVEEPPETLEEMTSIMEEHHEEDGETFGLGYPINPYYVSGFAQAYGEEVYDGEADELGIDTDAVEKGLRVIMDDLKPYMPDDPGPGAQTSVFENGNAPFFISGPWEIPHLEEEGVEFGVTTLPDLPDGGTPRPYAGYNTLFFGTRMDDDPDGAGAARNYARWLATDEEILLEHANQENYVPIHTELRASGRLPETIQGFADQLETADPMPRREKMDHVWGPFGHAIEQTFNGYGELRDNLDSAAAEIRETWEDAELSSAADPELSVNRLTLESADSGCGVF